MSRFSSLGRSLTDALQSLTLHVREVRGLVLVDRGGLPLASTLHAHALEESLAAFASSFSGLLDKAQPDLLLGPLRLVHVLARDRQLLWVPVDGETSLIAVVETGAHAGDVAVHLLALARELLAEVAAEASEDWSSRS